ncbi:hypothetical protein Nmel_006062, partial [Mimus melanotis]
TGAALSTPSWCFPLEWELECAAGSWERFAFPGPWHRDTGTVPASWVPAPREGAFPAGKPCTRLQSLFWRERGILFRLQSVKNVKTILEEPTKPFCPQDRWHKLQWSEAAPSVLLRGHWELIAMSPCPRALHDSWARLPGLSKHFTCTNCLTAPLPWMFSILAIQNFQKQIKRCQGTMLHIGQAGNCLRLPIARAPAARQWQKKEGMDWPHRRWRHEGDTLSCCRHLPAPTAVPLLQSFKKLLQMVLATPK